MLVRMDGSGYPEPPTALAPSVPPLLKLKDIKKPDMARTHWGLFDKFIEQFSKE